jgi:hypothetical protein
VLTTGVEPARAFALRLLRAKCLPIPKHVSIYSIVKLGARERIRTSTKFPPLPPQGSVSTIPPRAHLVLEKGFEPSRPFDHRFLKRARLPTSPLQHKVSQQPFDRTRTCTGFHQRASSKNENTRRVYQFRHEGRCNIWWARRESNSHAISSTSS